MASKWGNIEALKVKPKLSQEEFDEAVNTNIEDFDMTPEEAVKSAREEFELQGYDLSCVVQSKSSSELEKHPIAVATKAVQAAGDGTDALAEAYKQLQAAVSVAADQIQEVYAVATKNKTLEMVVGAAERTAARACTEGNAAGVDALVRTPLAIMRTLMGNLDIRDSFDDMRGPELLVDLLPVSGFDMSLQTEVVSTAEAAAFKEEQNKVRLMDLDFGPSLVKLLQKEDITAQLITAICGALKAFTSADDERPPGSKAFMHARLLSRTHGAIKVLLGVLRRLHSGPSPSDPALVSTLLATVRQLAANEEICKDFNDDGGIATCLNILSAHMAHRDIVRAGFGALRQLAHSDSVKTAVSEHRGVEVILAAVAAHQRDEEVLEPVLGLLVNIMLRKPEVVARAAEAGAIDCVVELMAELPRSSGVQRQCCMAVRNMVVRNTDLRPVLLEKGVEPLLRAAKKAHPRTCRDVGSAALRDLGLDNYND